MTRGPIRSLLRIVAVAAAIAVVGVGCAGAADTAPAAATAAPATSALVPIPNARVPIAGVLSGGQPSPEQVEAAARAGFKTVINIRTAGEPGFEWERGLVERLGMRYVHVPVGGADTLTKETVARIDGALREASARGPVLFHCASGNRTGATLALRAAWIDGASPADAYAFGVASGMTRLAEAVRQILGVQ